jgi:hypothetical protein
MCMMAGMEKAETIPSWVWYFFFAYNYPHTLESGSCGAFAELVYRRRCHTGKSSKHIRIILSSGRCVLHQRRVSSGIVRLGWDTHDYKTQGK